MLSGHLRHLGDGTINRERVERGDAYAQLYEKSDKSHIGGELLRLW